MRKGEKYKRAASASLAAPPLLKRRALRVRGTSITLLKAIQEKAEVDLGFKIEYELLDFPVCQRLAATEPDGYDVYEQCFHNLDIVWFWGALQAIDIERIKNWDKINNLAKVGSISKYAWRGHGDTPVDKLYVQPGGSLGSKSGRHISMLPTVHNADSFGFDSRVFGNGEIERASWAWLLDSRAKGKIALVDEPAIGFFDAALAAESSGELEFSDIGNMTIKEIDALLTLLEDRRKQGYFCGSWRNGNEAADFVNRDLVTAQSMWSPVYCDLGSMAGVFVEAAPLEGYRAWHGGASLARHLAGPKLDMAYEYLNWWLSGYAGAVMSRQGYYMSTPDSTKAVLSADEWNYWYEGAVAKCDLPGPSGTVAVVAGARRAGGTYLDRISRIAVWNTVMDEHNYAKRGWDRFIQRVTVRAQ